MAASLAKGRLDDGLKAVEIGYGKRLEVGPEILHAGDGFILARFLEFFRFSSVTIISSDRLSFTMPCSFHCIVEQRSNRHNFDHQLKPINHLILKSLGFVSQRL
jgi:hypothetical protein